MARKRHPKVDQYPKGNYQEDILKAYSAGLLNLNPGLHHLNVYHDDDCGIFEGKPCDCDPDIIQRADPQGDKNTIVPRRPLAVTGSRDCGEGRDGC